MHRGMTLSHDGGGSLLARTEARATWANGTDGEELSSCDFEDHTGDGAGGLSPADEPGRVPAGPAEGQGYRAEDQHLVALLLSRQLHDALATGWRHPRAEARRIRPELIHGCHNRTVVIDAHLGERENKQINVDPGARAAECPSLRGRGVDQRARCGRATWPTSSLCLNQVYPDGFMIPKRFIGENIIHLPTVKTHVFTTTTGAMKNAFGGLLNERRHWTHPVIHETLVDLLMIQKKIHSGVFAVMDGTFAGDGPGPRCMIPYVQERHPRLRRPGGDRRRRGQADGLRSR